MHILFSGILSRAETCNVIWDFCMRLGCFRDNILSNATGKRCRLPESPECDRSHFATTDFQVSLLPFFIFAAPRGFLFCLLQQSIHTPDSTQSHHPSLLAYPSYSRWTHSPTLKVEVRYVACCPSVELSRTRCSRNC